MGTKNVSLKPAGSFEQSATHDETVQFVQNSMEIDGKSYKKSGDKEYYLQA